MLHPLLITIICWEEAPEYARYSKIKSGPFEGQKEFEVAKSALEFWTKYIDEIKSEGRAAGLAL